MNKEIIDNFLKGLPKSSNGQFFILCGNCGAITELRDDNQYRHNDNIEQDINGVYSDYTGHLWDTVNIKCKKCGNAISFDK